MELIATEGDEELVERTFLMRDLTVRPSMMLQGLPLTLVSRVVKRERLHTSNTQNGPITVSLPAPTSSERCCGKWISDTSGQDP